jgi:[ribosomal protein S18]-alanine N-acetyltransferase
MTAGRRSPPAVRIAPLELADLAAVAEIERLSFPTPWSLSSFRYELVENPYATLFGLRPEHGPVVAFACTWVIDQELKINNIAVHPDWRGRGLGGRLVDFVLAFGRDQGCTEATLEVRPSNGAALRLYGRAGFRVVGRRRGYYSDTHEDALVMSCALEPRRAG